MLPMRPSQSPCPPTTQSTTWLPPASGKSLVRSTAPMCCNVNRRRRLNPEISSGLPLPTENRYPQPASRPETYATPATKASDPAFNPYWKRDTRRSYPQTSVITQSDLSALLLSSPALSSLPSPETAVETKPESSGIAPASPPSDAQQVVPAGKVPVLADVLQKLPQGKAYLGGGLTTGQGQGLPPVAPPALISSKWVPKAGEPVPHGEYAYFPMYTVT
ncbi:Hypothetical protein CGB_M2080W [Cryptococcus gattii WM276]|uniref:Uncharacterized protein n=2 Tax=Cryptococcus gattii TaxID=37769 RepID=E6RFA7_CRYGW|nr:Hypothetical protein CGB_M2080W [Cryptococcus gattii WM276]ADV25508.1 Hypothetical protein CGB_M2080W [Cryptococcus gattii WM276]KIR78920.1 hypothetical protein I306_04130 [Cryptococcus gattii EJB2]KJE05044.1 hypothetical protein I311_01137 [Cryptococcus gattii NT-10]